MEDQDLSKMKLQDMTREQKKKFFSMDLAERMIRVEQSVSASFNKSISYKGTEFYKSLSEQQKREFDKYLKSKLMKGVACAFILLLPIFLFSFLRISITGNVIGNSGNSQYLTIQIGLILFFILGSLIIINHLIWRRIGNKRFRKHLRVIENVFYRMPAKKVSV